VSQGAYSAANSFLDALATYRRTRGLVGQSWAWGPWGERGLAASLDGAQKARFASQGLGFFTPSQAIALFEASLSRPEPHLVLTLLDLRLLSKAFAGNVPPFWRALVRSSPFRAEAGTSNWATELAALSAEQRREAVTRAVRTEVARVLSFSNANAVPPDKPLKELGLDSLMAVELANALGRRTSSRIQATLAIHYPTPAAIADYLLRDVLAPRERVPRTSASDSPHLRGVEPGPARGERLNQLDNPRVRLFCFHQAGGAATTFEPFCELGSAGVEVHAISHSRSEAVTAESAERYLNHAMSYIRDHSQAPYCLFGHSLGGYFAWRVLEQLVTAGARLPKLFVPSAAAFPWPLQRFVSSLELEHLFREVSAGAAQADFLKEAFSADVRLWLALPERERRPQPVPIAAFVGAQDHLASETGMRTWAKATTQDFTLSILPGSHFYLADKASRELLFESLTARMSQW